jgi:protein O-mannosyl-transferase
VIYKHEKNLILKIFYTRLLSVILISCLGFIAYSNTFHSSFHFDDFEYIVNNFFIRNVQNLLNIWNFYPCRFVTFLSIAINFHFHQLNVFGYHLVNLIIHLGSAILVWWLTLLTLSTPVMKEDKISQHANLIALFAGLIFVSHPVQIEAVTYICQRAASMATFFYLASVCLYIKSRLSVDRGDPGCRPHYYIFSLITAIMAMFTKEISITLPLMILFYEFSFLKTKKKFNWSYIAPFLLILLIIPLTMLLTKSMRFQEIQDVIGGPGGISPGHYLLTQFRVTLSYIRLSFLPLNQNLDYDYPIYKNIFELPVFIGFLSLMTIFFAAKRFFLRYRIVSFSIIWFFLSLSPESSFLPFKDVIFEHRLYLPMAGYSIFLVSSIYYLSQKTTIKTMVVLLIMIITFNSVLTYQRNIIWKDEFTLWGDTAKKSPHKARPYIFLGFFYEQHNFFQAISNYSKAIEVDPKSWMAYNNRGLVYLEQGKTGQAVSDFNNAIKINPNSAVAYFNRCILYKKQGKATQAMFDFNKAIEINRNYYEKSLRYSYPIR